MTAKIITIAIQKGGTGKTTTVASMAAGLTERNFKVLCIDLDPQCNLSRYFRAEPVVKTGDILTGKEDIKKGILTSPYAAILPGDKELYNYTIEQLPANALKKAIAPILNYFEYIIIDNPPHLGPLTNNAIIASDEVIIATPIGDFCLDAIESICQSILAIKKYTKAPVEILGILITRKKSRVTLAQVMQEQFQILADKYHTRLFETAIRDCQAIQDAQTLKLSIYESAPRSNGSKDYRAFIDEYLKLSNKGEE